MSGRHGDVFACFMIVAPPRSLPLVGYRIHTSSIAVIFEV